MPSAMTLPAGARVLLLSYLCLHVSIWLVMMVCPSFYRRHRMAIVKAVRVYRLVGTKPCAKLGCCCASAPASTCEEQVPTLSDSVLAADWM